MAGARVEMPVNGAADWSSFVSIMQHMMQPFMSVSLTHMDDTLEPEIESVSAVIVKGTCYKFAADEAITGWAGIGDDTEAYIYIVPAGATCTAVWSDVAPGWDSDYQGYYNGNNRCIGGAYRDGAGDWTRKWLYGDYYRIRDLDDIPDGATYQRVHGDYVDANGRVDSIKEVNGARLLCKVIQLGDWNMDTTDFISVAHGLGADVTKIRTIECTIKSDGGFPYDSLFISGRVSVLDVTNLQASRETTGFFDNVGYDATSYNRGWITIWYEA